MNAAHPNRYTTPVGRGPSSPQPALCEIPDAIAARTTATSAEQTARVTSRHSQTVIGVRPQAGRPRRHPAAAGACSDLELAVLALHSTNQFAAAARLAATCEAPAYTRALAIRHRIVAEPGDRHHYAVALRAFATENRFLGERAGALNAWLKEHWNPETGTPTDADDFEPDAYLRLLYAEHRLSEDDGAPATDLAFTALRTEAHSLHISACRLAAWSRVTAEWLCPDLNRITPPWVTDLTASPALIC